MSSKLRKVVIPVAGLGTRGLPFTKVVPKELLPIIDTPTLHYIVEEVHAAGIDEVILVTSEGKTALTDYFAPHPELEKTLEARKKTALLEKVRSIQGKCEIKTTLQSAPLGLGHAVLCAKELVGEESFAVCLGDQIFPQFQKGAANPPDLANMVNLANELKASVIGVMKVDRSSSLSYGMVDVGGQSIGKLPVKVVRAVEKPSPEEAPSEYAIIGRYVFTPEVFQKLEVTQPGTGGEIQLTDAINDLAAEGKLYAVLIDPIGYDVGNHFAYVQAQVEAGLARSDLKGPLTKYLKGLDLS